jgi:acyl-coenzyme A thioesterase PaaI-like protein
VRAGRTLSVCHADVFSTDGSEERHVAMMTATMMRVARTTAAGS